MKTANAVTIVARMGPILMRPEIGAGMVRSRHSLVSRIVVLAFERPQATWSESRRIQRRPSLRSTGISIFKAARPFHGATRSRLTLHMPPQPIALEAGGVRSISRRGQNLRLGPLSATVQTTDLPLATLVTRSRWPICSSICAQAKSRWGCSRLPSAVTVSSNCVATPPYGGGLMRVSQRSSNVSARAHRHMANSVSAESMGTVRTSMPPILLPTYGRDRGGSMPIFRLYRESPCYFPAAAPADGIGQLHGHSIDWSEDY